MIPNTNTSIVEDDKIHSQPKLVLAKFDIAITVGLLLFEQAVLILGGAVEIEANQGDAAELRSDDKHGDLLQKLSAFAYRQLSPFC